MNDFHFAVNDLIRAARSGPFGPAAEAAQRVLELMEQSNGVPSEDAGWAVNHLAPLLVDPRSPYPPVAWTCEALLRCGADPWAALGLIVERLMDALETSAELVREAGNSSLEQHVAALARSEPWRAMAWMALGPMCGVCLPVVDHFPHARQLLRSRESVAAALATVAPLCEPAAEIARLLEDHAPRDPQESPGDNVERVLENLTEVRAHEAERGDEATPALRELMMALFCVELSTRNRALVRLGEIVRACHPGHLGSVAMVCGSIVETGGEPNAAVDALVERLREVLPAASAFAAACEEAAEARGIDLDEVDRREMIDEIGPDLAGTHPREYWCWESAGELCLGTIAMLSRSVEARKRHGGDAGLMAAAHDLSDLIGPAGFLWKMLRVLDDEELVVLEPARKLGWRVRIGGLADNFQLHGLIAATLVGPEDEGLIPAVVGSMRPGDTSPVPERKIDPRVADLLRDLPVTYTGQPSLWSFLNLWTWQALRRDGTLPADAMANNRWFIWNEGVPADIPSFEGTRVVLLGSVSFSRSWNCGRVFDGMAGELEVVEKLSPEKVGEWLRRLAAAPKE